MVVVYRSSKGVNCLKIMVVEHRASKGVNCIENNGAGASW